MGSVRGLSAADWGTLMNQDPDETANAAVSAVSFQLGELSQEESSKIHGAVYGRVLTDPSAPIGTQQIQRLTDLVRALRVAPCRWCRGGISEHTFEMTTYETMIWCDKQAKSRTTEEWLTQASQPPPQKNLALALLLWVALPLLSCGFLAWLPPTIATFKRNDRIWTIGAIVLGALTVLALVLIGPAEEGEVMYDMGTAVGIVTWIGGTVFCGLQVRRWMAV